MNAGEKVLNEKYRLLPKALPSTGSSMCRIGLDEFDTAFLVKLWPYKTDEPDELLRALWDTELRTLYRVSSSPGAEDTILVIRDARLDRDIKAFVMVLESSGVSGYETLAELFATRNALPWLSSRDAAARREMWAGLQRLANGLRLLHHQNVLHRNLVPETVFVDSKIGTSSLRLGGFEWSLRLGVPQGDAPPVSWATPPELFDVVQCGYRPETDWYAFGMLAVRCFLNVEEFAVEAPKDRHGRVIRQLEKSTAQLSDLERSLLLRLIAPDARDRLSHSNDICTGILDVLEALDYGGDPRTVSRPLVLVIDPKSNDALVSQCLEVGFIPNPEDPTEAFNPHDFVHTANLTSFIQADLKNAQLYALPNSEVRLLVGADLGLRVAQFQSYDTGTQRSTWDLAYCFGVSELRKNEGGPACKELPESVIAVRTTRQVAKGRTFRQQAQSWERFLPTIDRTQQLRASLSRFYEFIRCTNQLELLIRDAEIFAYQLDSYRKDDDGVEHAFIHEVPRARPPFRFFKIEGGLSEFLHREIETGKPFCRRVVLTPPDEDGLYIPGIDNAECWIVYSLSDSTIHLIRPPSSKRYAEPSASGNIRAYGMFGQIALIRRRKKAIDRLETHSYLLRSLSAPGQVYMDTGEFRLPIPPNPEEVDLVKQAVMKDILQVRPIYSLQGPPGTGKTTLVAHLVRQILEDDSVAQILITAQAHGAVDVLRAKVRDEAFRDTPERDQPLAVRLGKYETAENEGSVVSVCVRILGEAVKSLSSKASLSTVQEEWLADCRDMLVALDAQEHDSSAADFAELVRRGANLTYCTTSAGDLEELAEGAQSFDWSIVEESGKAHGFDLALPLQAGHRWLLIGDHKQLPPYRMRDYRDGIDNLDDGVTALMGLHERDVGLIDLDWIRHWNDSSADECSVFKDYARQWLKVFERVFQYCRKAPGVERMTSVDTPGAAAGMLSHQYRMHPSIGRLVSEAYYDELLLHKTESASGEPIPKIKHPFSRPNGLSGRAVVWVDIPWCQRVSACEEHGPHINRPRYTNPAEVMAIRRFLEDLTADMSQVDREHPLSLAVLATYSQQMRKINAELKSLSLPDGLTPKTDLRSADESNNNDEPSRLAYTVDSFQGNEADVVLVSLVRNNSLLPEEGLGFLEEAPRINVLLSRAERLLVLVGSWDFFSHQVSTVRLEDTHHTLWHWKRVLTTLSEYFERGEAIRLPAKLK
jgi:hypothetical protein